MKRLILSTLAAALLGASAATSADKRPSASPTRCPRWIRS